MGVKTILAKSLSSFTEGILSERRIEPSAFKRLTIYTGAALIVAVMFSISLTLRGESESLFAMLYACIAIVFAATFGHGPGLFCGILTALSVDYHYIRPIGRILSSLEGYLFLAVTLLLRRVKKL